MSAAILGGDWTNGANSGSRASNWNNYPWNSNGNIGARGRCDDQVYGSALAMAVQADHTARCGHGGQPGRPASANTLRGPVQRGVAQSKPATGIPS
jgi:hypothetical protein